MRRDRAVWRPAYEQKDQVVAAFSAQVQLLRGVLPTGVEVGTVDKFQGQEALVVSYSMASSSGEDIPRGLGFLLSRNRLNVAVSRAQALAYLVCSSRLLEADCKTIPRMRLANALCRCVELGALPRSVLGQAHERPSPGNVTRARGRKGGQRP